MDTAPITSHSLAQTFVEPPGKVLLLYGDKSIFPVSLTMAAHAISQGSSVAVVDGCNRFDVHLLTRFARERQLDADAFLRRIFVSRGFTCYQMEQAIAHRLPAFLNSTHSRTAMIFGLLDTFYDEQAPFREVQQILTRLFQAFKQMKQSGISLLLVSLEFNVLPKERNRLFTALKQGTDQVYKLEVNEEGRPRLHLEVARREVAHLDPFWVPRLSAKGACPPVRTIRQAGISLRLRKSWQ